MANTRTGMIPKIFSMFQPVLRQSFEFVSNVQKDFDGASAKIGDTVTIPLPNSLTTTAVTPGQYPPAPTDLTSNYTTITIDQWYRSQIFHIDFKEGGEVFDKPQIVESNVQEAVRSVLYGINAYMWGKYTGVYGYAGSAGANPFTTDIKYIADAGKVLDQQLCPLAGRRISLGPIEKAAALQSDDLRKYINLGDQEAVRAGRLGVLLGFDTGLDQQRPVHTAGTGTSWVVATTAAAGVSTLTVTGGTGTMLVGDVFVKQNDTQTYVVTTALTNGTVVFQPALVTTAAANETITSKATHAVNLAYHPRAFGLVMRTPRAAEMIGSGNDTQQHFPFRDPETGIVLLLSHFVPYMDEYWQVSALYGGALVRAQLACRIAGGTA